MLQDLEKLGGELKVPAQPPDVDAVLEAAGQQGRRLNIFQASLQLRAMSGDYLAWDKLRYKQPPDDLTHEEWWAATRLARTMVERPVDRLVDVEGRPFTFTLPDAVLRSIENVNRAASGHIAVSEQVTNASTRDRYLVSSLIEEAITSSQLEGAATSRRVAKEMIRSGRPPADRGERMILNNYRAMRQIIELQHEELSPELVCELHRIVTEGTLDNPAAAGVLQSDETERVAVWGDGDQLLHRPPPVDELPERLRRVCAFANGDGAPGYVPPVLRAITVHFMMGYDHYFEDGNGRTARALFYWTMLREGFWLTEFVPISRILKQAPAQYARSFLLTEQDHGDLTHFFLYQLDVLERAIKDLHEYLARKASEVRDLQRSMRARPGVYNHRQLALLESAVKDPGAEYSVRSHSLSHNTSGETARHDLRALENAGLLVRSRRGKQYVWVPVSDLVDRLEG